MAELGSLRPSFRTLVGFSKRSNEFANSIHVSSLHGINLELKKKNCPGIYLFKKKEKSSRFFKQSSLSICNKFTWA